MNRGTFLRRFAAGAAVAAVAPFQAAAMSTPDDRIEVDGDDRYVSIKNVTVGSITVKGSPKQLHIENCMFHASQTGVAFV